MCIARCTIKQKRNIYAVFNNMTNWLIYSASWPITFNMMQNDITAPKDENIILAENIKIKITERENIQYRIIKEHNIFVIERYQMSNFMKCFIYIQEIRILFSPFSLFSRPWLPDKLFVGMLVCFPSLFLGAFLRNKFLLHLAAE